MKKIQLTAEGHSNLKRELSELKEIKRPAVVDRLQKARSMGDLKENNAYQSAREELGELDGRILELEHILKNVEIVQTSLTQEVQMGNTVTVEVGGVQSTFAIVGEFESDPMNGKLSITSPIGAALIGAKVHMSVNIALPTGVKTYKILSIR